MFLLIGGGPGSIAAGNRISIHLMFLLIVLKSSFATCSLHFNTSHVSINRNVVQSVFTADPYFNTSYVSINPVPASEQYPYQSFQYILCFY